MINDLLLLISSPSFVASIGSALLVAFFASEIEKVKKLIVKVFRSSPKFFVRVMRGIRAREKKKLKKMRRNGDLVTFQSMKTHTYFLLFMASIFYYVALAALGPLDFVFELPKSYQLLVAIPVYLFEILWLLNSGLSRALIESRGRLRLDSTRRSKRGS